MSISRGPWPAVSLLLLCVLGALVHGSSAATHKVSWIIPTGSAYYDNWASGEIFQLGDTLEFDYVPNGHNVLMVLPKDAASCDISNPLQTWNGASAKVSLDTVGTISFICGFPSHCALGMKMTLTVVPPASAPPAPKRQSQKPPMPTAPVPSPLKKNKSPQSVAPAPSHLKEISSPVVSPAPALRVYAPAPLPETAAASVVKFTGIAVIAATLLVSCSAILF